MLPPIPQKSLIFRNKPVNSMLHFDGDPLQYSDDKSGKKKNSLLYYGKYSFSIDSR